MSDTEKPTTPTSEGSHAPPDSRAPQGGETIPPRGPSARDIADPRRSVLQPEPTAPPPIDLNWALYELVTSVANLDVSGQRLCMRIEQALPLLERLVASLEIGVLRETVRTAGDGIPEAIDQRVALLLAVSEQVAASPNSGTGGDGGEAASPDYLDDLERLAVFWDEEAADGAETVNGAWAEGRAESAADLRTLMARWRKGAGQ